MSNEFEQNSPNVTTIQIEKDMIKDVAPKIHIIRSKKGVIVEDILFDNGEVKKGIRYFLDPESLASMGACEISVTGNQVKEHGAATPQQKNPMSGFVEGLPPAYDIPAAPKQIFDPSEIKEENK